MDKALETAINQAIARHLPSNQMPVFFKGCTNWREIGAVERKHEAKAAVYRSAVDRLLILNHCSANKISLAATPDGGLFLACHG